jgi:hypothetical protein
MKHTVDSPRIEHEKQRLEKKYYPKLNQNERTIFFNLARELHSIVLDERVKKKALESLNDMYRSYVTAKIQGEQRALFRDKLLNVCGLQGVIAREDILTSIRGVGRANDIVNTYDFRDFDFANTIKKEFEIASYQIVFINEFKILFDLSATNKFYNDLLSQVNSIVFSGDVVDVISGAYLSSTNEPLSKTILINTTLEDGLERDPISMMSDIILQSSFLKNYHDTSMVYESGFSEMYARKTVKFFYDQIRKNIRGQLKQSGINLSWVTGRNEEQIVSKNATYYTMEEYIDFIDILDKHNDALLEGAARA